MINNDMEKINCPNCPHFLLRYNKDGKENLVAELKCAKCKCIVLYDFKQNKILDIKKKANKN